MGACQALRQALRSGEPVVSPQYRSHERRTAGELCRGGETGNAYADAGADMIMALPRTAEEARQLPKEMHKPEVYMLSIAGDRPPFTLQDLYAMGYPLIIEAQGGLMMAYGAMRKAYLELKEKGRISCDVAEIKLIRDEINALVDLPKYWELEGRTVEQ
jgi:2-methylisocitrate lyase-like PEP mutase family enzyme